MRAFSFDDFLSIYYTKIWDYIRNDIKIINKWLYYKLTCLDLKKEIQILIEINLGSIIIED